MKIIADIVKSSKKITVYHGDNFGNTKLIPKYMIRHEDGGNQEGIGIYFGNRETADSYGKYVVSAKIDPSRFIKARESLDEQIPMSNIIELFKILHKINDEEFWYYLTDFGIEIYNSEDVTDDHLEFLAEKLAVEEARNFSIDLAQRFGVEEFVKAWNQTMDIDGFYTVHPIDTYYAIINTDIKLKKENF